MVEKFINDEQGYIDWIRQHPDAYVANLNIFESSDFFLIHRASCSKICSTPHPGGFTERMNIKVASTSLAELEEWGMANRNIGLTKPRRCKICSPE